MNHPKLHLYLKSHDILQYYLNEVAPTLRLFDSIGINVETFAYPYGYNTKISDEFLDRQFKKVRTVARYANSDKYVCASISDEKQIDGLSICSLNAKSLNIYKTEILKAKESGGILVLIEHRPVQKVNKNNTFSYALLDSICNFVRQQNMQFYRIQDI